MFTHTHHIETIYTVSDIVKYTTNLMKESHGKQVRKYDIEHTNICLDFIAKFIKEDRYEMLSTWGSYEIITNGYGEFKHVKIIEGGTKIPATEIFKKMANIEGALI